jgi:hypothetical protein
LPAHILSVLSNFSYAYMTERGKWMENKLVRNLSSFGSLNI